MLRTSGGARRAVAASVIALAFLAIPSSAAFAQWGRGYYHGGYHHGYPHRGYAPGYYGYRGYGYPYHRAWGYRYPFGYNSAYVAPGFAPYYPVRPYVYGGRAWGYPGRWW